MGLFIRQQGQRTELQQKITADLREKLQNEKPLEYEKPTSNYENDSHESQYLGPIIALVAAVVALGVVYLLFAR